MLTKGPRLLCIMGAFLLVLAGTASMANAQTLRPPERLTGPTRPSITSAAVTIAESRVSPATGHAVINLLGPDSVQTGDQFIVTVQVIDAVDLYGLQIALGVDPAKFQVLGVTPGLLFGPQSTYQVGPAVATDGSNLSYAVTLTGPTAVPFSGNGTLMVISLKALVASGQAAQIWSSAATTLGNPQAVLLSSSVTAAPLWIGTPIQGVARSIDQPLSGLRVTLVEQSTGYEIDEALTGADGTFSLTPQADGEYLIRSNELPFLPAAVAVSVLAGVPTVDQLQMNLVYGDWDGDGVVTKVDLDRFAVLYYAAQLDQTESWIDIARMGASLNRFDLRDLYYVAYNQGETTPPAVRMGWVYGSVSNVGPGAIARAAIDVMPLAGGPVESFYADQKGFYTFALPVGSYQLTFGAAQYQSLTQTITVNPLGYLQFYATLPPIAVALVTPIQVDLNWTAVGDMDSLLVVPGSVATTPGLANTTVSGLGYSGQSGAHPWAVHLGDAVQSSGTESVIVHRLMPGVYQFWAQIAVGDLTTSMNVSVTISGGTQAAQTINLSTSTGTGYQWRVFTLTVATEGTYVITPTNTLHDSADLSGGGSGVTTLGSKR